MRKELITIFKEFSNDEVVEAYNYYESKKIGLGEYFLNDLKNTINAIKLSPNGFVRFHQYRQVRLTVFLL